MTDRVPYKSYTRKDFRIDTMRGSGAGGQHRNKTDSAVRITHIETGLVGYCESHRSQHQNRKTAFRALARKLVAHINGDQSKERYQAGKDVVRTYHEPDDRVVDSTGGRYSYRATVGKGDLSQVIEDRRNAIIKSGGKP